MHVWGVRMSHCACCRQGHLPEASLLLLCVPGLQLGLPGSSGWCLTDRATRLAPVVMVCKCEMPVWWAEVNSLTAKK